MSGAVRYRLAARTSGTSVFNLTVAQLLLLGAGGLVAVALITRHVTAGHVIAAGVVLAVAGAAAFIPIGGRSACELVPTLVRHATRSVARRNRWFVRLPLTGGDGGLEGGTDLPLCLRGMELWGVARPGWAGAENTVAPVGLVFDKRTRRVTGAIAVKGAEFQLIDEQEQHDRIFAWGRVLASFAREASPVVRICWHEWSCPAPLSEHVAWLASRRDAAAPAAAHYAKLLADQATAVARHELRVTVTVDPRHVRSRRRVNRRSGAEAALTTVRALSDRCREAGLVVSDPLSAADLGEAVRLGADPAVLGSGSLTHRGLAERAGLIPPVCASPLAIEARWGSVRTDGGVHRSFWVSSWPALDIGPRWLEPLLLDTIGTRTVTMVMEPVSPRASRRRINKEAVMLMGNVQNREKHGFRVPVELERAKVNLDRREVELSSGFAEFRYLALIDVCARTDEELDELSAAYGDLAAQCGLDLRALDGRHDAAWACSLPIGRAPDRDLIAGLIA